MHTVLARVGEREVLGKTRDLSEFGLTLILPGRHEVSGQPITTSVVFGTAVLDFHGHVVHVRPNGTDSRLGVRLSRLAPPTWWQRPRERGPGAPPTPAGSLATADLQPPFETNLGLHVPLVSDADLRRLRRDAAALEELLGAEDLAGAPAADWEERLRSFAARNPDHPARPRVLRELFRASMAQHYPCLPGITLEGRLRNGSEGGGGVPGEPCVILLDGFAVARSDRQGRFVARGIPPPPFPVVVPLAARGEGLTSVRAPAITLSNTASHRISIDLAVVPRDDEEAAMRSLRAAIDAL